MIEAEHISPVLGLIRRRKLCIDPMYAGELRRLREDPNVGKSYFSRRGMTVDELGEALWDHGFVHYRPDCNEVLHLINQIFTPSKLRRRREVVSIARDLLQIFADGREYSRRDLRRILALDPEVDLGRAIRRLRGKPWNLTVRTRRARGTVLYVLDDHRSAAARLRLPEEAYGGGLR